MRVSSKSRLTGKFLEKYDLPSILLLIIYICATAPLFFLPVAVPDELLFLGISTSGVEKIASDGLLSYLFWQPNELGYGSAYWIINTLTLYLFNENLLHSLYCLRALNLLSILSIPFTLLLVASKYGCDRKFTRLVLVLWLSQGIAWWYGKIVGPEIVPATLAFFGVALLLRSSFEQNNKVKLVKLFLSSLLLGLSFGIRLTIFPMVLFAAVAFSINYFNRPLHNFRQVFQTSISALAGFTVGLALANPFTLFPGGGAIWLSNLKAATGGEVFFSYERLIYSLHSSIWHWDAIQNGGLLQLGFGSIVLLSLLFYKASNKTLTIACSAVYILSFLILSSRPMLSWYLFPLIVLPFSTLVGTVTRSNQRISSLKYCFYIFIVFGMLLFNLPYLSEGYANKIEHYSNISKANLAKECVANAVQDKNDSGELSNIDTVLDFSEIYLVRKDPRSGVTRERRYVDYLPLEALETKNVTEVPIGGNTLSFFFEDLSWAAQKISSGKTILFLSGHRFQGKSFPVLPLVPHVLKILNAKSLDNYYIKESGSCEYLDFALVTKLRSD
ncbi:MAG: hypothetical protein DCF15_03305 [Phormidesmis priestleyi]|uniref:Glycosyltransferase RgtA/B/C/D-like domain-containing protein n=1 Tax=Phormidesmis priestleyi TaxID=268141 RepID=A0A2W4XYL7_9CYAN|nr:MAG: hypothetical protein DCF15_03305 [Phormidesmis priestleyi]